MLLDGSLELFDILRPTFPKSGLRLAVPLLSFFRGRVYLLLD